MEVFIRENGEWRPFGESTKKENDEDKKEKEIEGIEVL